MGDEEKHIGALCSDECSLGELEDTMYDGTEMSDPLIRAMPAADRDVFLQDFPKTLKSRERVYRFCVAYLGRVFFLDMKKSSIVYNNVKTQLGLAAPPRKQGKVALSQQTVVKALNDSYAELFGKKK